MIAAFGGGEIAAKCGVPVTPVNHVDVRCFPLVRVEMTRLQPQTVLFTAGVSHPKTVAESDPSDWEHELSVNLFGAYNVAKAAVHQGVGTMIFLASVAGMYGKPNHSGYSASKRGIVSLVQSLGMEGHNAYAISPGRVDTAMREKDYPGEDPRTRLVPLEIGMVISDILAGVYEPGDNIIIRRIGFDTHVRVDKGEPWREWLRVGQPPVV